MRSYFSKEYGIRLLAAAYAVYIHLSFQPARLILLFASFLYHGFALNIGATFIKGFNRGLGTFGAAVLAFCFGELAILTGKLEKVVIVISIFLIGMLLFNHLVQKPGALSC